MLTVRPAVGNKAIHPYSDFLLLDIGSGDGISMQPVPAYDALTPAQKQLVLKFLNSL